MPFITQRWYILFLCCLIAGSLDAQPARIKKSINEVWKFHLGNTPDSLSDRIDASSWETINLPHTWNAHDVVDEKDGYYRGIGWYRKSIKFSSVDKNKKLYLFFEGANQVTEVYLNNKYIGTHKGGYTAFSFDITNNVIFDAENIISVRVDNRNNVNIPPLSADFTFYGGIYRDVFLVVTDEVHFDMLYSGSSGVRVTPTVDASKKTIVNIISRAINDSQKDLAIKITYRIKDADHTVISETGNTLRIKRVSRAIINYTVTLTKEVKLWSPENPNLYTIDVILTDKKSGKMLDNLIFPLAFRFFSFDPATGMSLNGKPYKLIGTSRHQDYKELGNALPVAIHINDINLIKNMGGNFIRISHYPQAAAILEACDKLGLVAWEEIPVVNGITDSKGFTASSLTMLQEMIRQHYNHPSVFIWGYMNEPLLKIPYKRDETAALKNYTTAVANLARKLDSTARAEDHTRYTAMAFHGNFEIYQQTGLTAIPMINGWNLYQGWYGADFLRFTEFVKHAHEAAPSKPIIIGEYGAGSDVRIHAVKPRRFDFSMEYAIQYHQSYIKQIQQHQFISGAAIWNLIDFNSEGREDTNPHINNKGIVEEDRTPKDVYYLYQAYLKNKPVLKIAAQKSNKRSGCPANAADSFSIQPVTIFTNCADVDVYCNDKFLSSQIPKDHVVSIDIPFVQGENKIDVKSKSCGIDDRLVINFKLLPFQLNDPSFEEININAGAQFYFTDDITGTVWLPDKPYEKGTYGHISGKPYVIWMGTRVGSDKEIKGTTLQPLFQTQVDSLEAYQVDVGEGYFEVSLCFAELLSVHDREQMVYNLNADAESVKHSNKRVFDVRINDILVEDNFDLTEEAGALQAVIKKYRIYVASTGGVKVSFDKKEGNPVLNAISVRKIY